MLVYLGCGARDELEQGVGWGVGRCVVNTLRRKELIKLWEEKED